jgi:hypothetical protein
LTRPRFMASLLRSIPRPADRRHKLEGTTKQERVDLLNTAELVTTLA